jgi:hypothetical protein
MASLIGVNGEGPLAVAFFDFLLCCGGLYAEQVVEGNVLPIVGDNLVAETKNLVICRAPYRLAFFRVQTSLSGKRVECIAHAENGQLDAKAIVTHPLSTSPLLRQQTGRAPGQTARGASWRGVAVPAGRRCDGCGC